MDSTPQPRIVPSGSGIRHLARKPIELICCAPGQSLSHVQRRILTAICEAVARFQDAEVVCFTPRELSLAIGNDGENLQELHKASAAMRDLTAWLNPLEVDSPPASLPVFTEVSCSAEEILYRLDPRVGQLILSGESYAEVDPLVEKRLGAANALALYELAMLFMRRGERPTFPAARWRELITGSSTKENERFVTSKIIKLSVAALEMHACVRPIVVRLSGPRADRIRLEFETLTLPSCDVPKHGKCSAEVPSDHPPPHRVPDADTSAGSANGVDAFEQLLGSWNAQFARQDRSKDEAPKAAKSPRVRAEASAAHEGESDEVMASWRAARTKTSRLKEQLQRAEGLEREAALRALRSAIQRYGMSPEEIFGALVRATGFDAPCAERTASAETGGEMKWMN
jgi:hypothetical protein